MADSATSPSLSQQTMTIIKATVSQWWPWFLLFGLILGVIQMAFTHYFDNSPIVQFFEQHIELQSNPEILKTNQALYDEYVALVTENFPELLGYFTLYLIILTAVQIVVFYFFAVVYLNRALPEASLTINAKDFSYWGKQVAWKYTRPFLWLLLPVIGIYFYMRSVVRSMVVTPLALLRAGNELETSWTMTEGKAWRLFGQQMLVVFTLIIFSWFVFILPVSLLALATHTEDTAAFHALTGLAQGMMTSLLLLGSAIYCVVAYVNVKAKNKADQSLSTYSLTA
jgi:hypothetical protein